MRLSLIWIGGALDAHGRIIYLLLPLWNAWRTPMPNAFKPFRFGQAWMFTIIVVTPKHLTFCGMPSVEDIFSAEDTVFIGRPDLVYDVSPVTRYPTRDAASPG